eukprot:CAMPEP_0196571946 /NCGR_PEP_ID=MMETSP1081-20130531/2078_1 /TAXON_ID=36882 /ORGANISM="Pyramimonas amylifera, Strain CCMP720" /LENGTH=187 /DNA_ID=CAMNT_0041889093 /DNA_START=255 /DNA_END=818 /DNA_ORIENTATION=-
MNLNVANEDPERTFDQYFQDTNRIVYITFPDESRRSEKGDGSWEVRLNPIRLLFVEFRAVNTIQCWSVPSGLNLKIDDLVLEGAPPEMDLNNKIKFETRGQLRVVRSHPHSKCMLEGKVALQLDADVPSVMADVPVMDSMAQGILDTILKNLEVSLVNGLKSDYRIWIEEGKSSKSKKPEKLNASVV